MLSSGNKNRSKRNGLNTDFFSTSKVLLIVYFFGSSKITTYLADIDEQAEEMFFRLVKQLAEKEGVTEQLKAENQMLWVARMNNIRSHAMEIVNTELIYV